MKIKSLSRQMKLMIKEIENITGRDSPRPRFLLFFLFNRSLPIFTNSFDFNYYQSAIHQPQILQGSQCFEYSRRIRIPLSTTINYQDSFKVDPLNLLGNNELPKTTVSLMTHIPSFLISLNT
jgi:hypothetical protein